MLSLLSLIIASGTVLRADTDPWEPMLYPDPRTNATKCNTLEGSTLCDPDHILTDTWRQTIQDNISKQVARLQTVEVPYTDSSSAECRSNETEPVQIFVILAKRIQTVSNQSITSNDLTTFGHGLRDAFGLDTQSCKNYILILGVELAKEIYVWTGSDLAIPKEQIDYSLSQYKNLFIERNYMEGLNKIVDELGDLLVDPFKDVTTVATEVPTSEPIVESTSTDTTTNETPVTSVPTWIYAVMILCILIALSALGLLAFLFLRRGRSVSIQPYPLHDGKVPPALGDLEQGEDHLRSSVPYVIHNTPKSENEEDKESSDESGRSPSIKRPKKLDLEEDKSMTSEVSLPRSASLGHADTRGYLADDFSTGTNPRKMVIRKRPDSSSDSSSSDSDDDKESKPKVCISPLELSTDRVTARRNSDTTRPPISPKYPDHFSSF